MIATLATGRADQPTLPSFLGSSSDICEHLLTQRPFGHFNAGSPAIYKRAVDILTEIALGWKSSPGSVLIDSVQIAGEAPQLARDRAATVVDFLVRAGISRSVIWVRFSPDDGSVDEQLSRRVYIYNTAVGLNCYRREVAEAVVWIKGNCLSGANQAGIEVCSKALDFIKSVP